jgi:hypothetical protein
MLSTGAVETRLLLSAGAVADWLTLDAQPANTLDAKINTETIRQFIIFPPPLVWSGSLMDSLVEIF